MVHRHRSTSAPCAGPQQLPSGSAKVYRPLSATEANLRTSLPIVFFRAFVPRISSSGTLPILLVFPGVTSFLCCGSVLDQLSSSPIHRPFPSKHLRSVISLPPGPIHLPISSSDLAIVCDRYRPSDIPPLRVSPVWQLPHCAVDNKTGPKACLTLVCPA